MLQTKPKFIQAICRVFVVSSMLYNTKQKEVARLDHFEIKLNGSYDLSYEKTDHIY